VKISILGCILGRIVETASGNHRKVRHRAGFAEQARAALRAKAAAQRIAAFRFAVVSI
jgi:hypothetical protein